MTKKEILEIVDQRLGVDIYEKIFQVLCQSLHITNAQKIGSGRNGIAYKYDDKVLKITMDESEAEMKYKLINLKLKHLPHIYKVYKLSIESLRKYGYNGDDNIFVIIQEYAQPLSQDWGNFLEILGEVASEDEIDGWPDGAYLDTTADYIKNFNAVRRAMSSLYTFKGVMYNSFYELLREMHRLGIDSIDFIPSNFGLNHSGDLIFFDIGFGSGGLVVKNEITF